MPASTATSIRKSLTPLEETAVKLREGGMSIAKIMGETGLSERNVKRLVADIPKPAKIKRTVARIATPFDLATEQVYLLAKRPTGISDYELRDILHKVYGSTWDTTIGAYQSNYNPSTLKRVKAEVRKRAVLNGCNVIFVTDWIDKTNPRASLQFLKLAASNLMDRLEECLDDYMALYGAHCDEDAKATELARRKQRYAARQHVLKLAVKGYGVEPIALLNERAAALVDALEGEIDADLPKVCSTSGAGTTQLDTPSHFPEPSRRDAFLDFAQSQGWT